MGPKGQILDPALGSVENLIQVSIIAIYKGSSMGSIRVPLRI